MLGLVALETEFRNANLALAIVHCAHGTALWAGLVIYRSAIVIWPDDGTNYRTLVLPLG